MAVQRIWLLNFDADEELARPVGYTPSAAVLSRFAPLADRAEGLVPIGDVVLAEWRDQATVLSGDFEGRAFCPTPRAVRVLARAGAKPPAAPSIEVLRRVNHRAFSAELGQCLPGARYVRDRSELESTLASSSGPWILKRAFGFAGRGRQRLRAGTLDSSVEPFVRASLESDGLQVEPWALRELDVGLHGFVSRTSAITLGVPTRQRTDDSGAWLESTRAMPGDLLQDEERALFDEAERTARALVRAGYFGPFGIDGFRWVDARGSRHFCARCEINARYSMGWAIGIGELRPDLAE
jgi:hypothetical protein